MKYTNELKVGIVVVLSAVIFYVGYRFFQDIPIIKGTYELETAFADAGGLVTGNAVLINGVNVGSVERVELRPGSDQAHVLFQVHRGVAIPQGSTTSVGGVSALGIVRMDIALGPTANPPYQPGDFLPSKETDVVGELLARVPVVGRADSFLVGATATLEETRLLLADPQSDLRQTLVAARGSAQALTALLRAEQGHLAQVLASADTLIGNLNSVTGDSLDRTVQNLNQVLGRLDRNLASLESTSARLDLLLGKVERGEGTLGLLVNDPSLYLKLDSTLTNMNRIMLDFERNPKRYLKDLKLVDVF